MHNLHVSVSTDYHVHDPGREITKFLKLQMNSQDMIKTLEVIFIMNTGYSAVLTGQLLHKVNTHCYDDHRSPSVYHYTSQWPVPLHQ